MKNVIVNDKSWQLKCQYWSAFDQAGQGGLVVVVNMTITFSSFLSKQWAPSSSTWTSSLTRLSSSSSSSTFILVWVIFFKSSFVKECCNTQEFYKGILLRAAMATRGIFRNMPVICFGLSSIPSMTLKRRKVPILQVIQQMTDRTHQMGNNPLIPVLLFDLTVQICKQFKI